MLIDFNGFQLKTIGLVTVDDSPGCGAARSMPYDLRQDTRNHRINDVYHPSNDKTQLFEHLQQQLRNHAENTNIEYDSQQIIICLSCFQKICFC